MGKKVINKIVLILAASTMAVPAAQAQWNYEVDVKSQISANALDCTSCNLSGKDYSGTKLKNSRFSGAILDRINLSGAIIHKSDFSGAHLKKAFLVRVKGQNVIFRGANLNGATLSEIEAKNCDFQGATMADAELRKGALLESNLREANLRRLTALASNFEGSDLSYAELDGANVIGANFKNTILKKTKFGTANVSGAKFMGARLEGAKMSSVRGLKQKQLDGACGDGKTELPVDLTITYCSEVLEETPVHEAAMHASIATHNREIVLRTERALRNTELLMKNAPREERLVLQGIHADLSAILRTLKK